MKGDACCHLGFVCVMCLISPLKYMGHNWLVKFLLPPGRFLAGHLLLSDLTLVDSWWAGCWRGDVNSLAALVQDLACATCRETQPCLTPLFRSISIYVETIGRRN